MWWPQGTSLAARSPGSPSQCWAELQIKWKISTVSRLLPTPFKHFMLLVNIFTSTNVLMRLSLGWGCGRSVWLPASISLLGARIQPWAPIIFWLHFPVCPPGSLPFLPVGSLQPLEPRSHLLPAERTLGTRKNHLHPDASFGLHNSKHLGLGKQKLG